MSEERRPLYGTGVCRKNPAITIEYNPLSSVVFTENAHAGAAHVISCYLWSVPRSGLHGGYTWQFFITYTHTMWRLYITLLKPLFIADG